MENLKLEELLKKAKVNNMGNKKVYVVCSYWYDFEDYDCNCYNVEAIYNNFYSAKQKAISLVVDEIDSEMKVDKQFGNDEPTLEDLLHNLDEYGMIFLKQKYGSGQTRIEILERVVNR